MIDDPAVIPELLVYVPHRPSFGEPSSIVVPIPSLRPLSQDTATSLSDSAVVSSGPIVRQGNNAPDLHQSSVSLPNSLSNQMGDHRLNGNSLTNKNSDSSALDVDSPSQLRRRSQRRVKFPDVAVPSAKTARKPSQVALLSIGDGVFFRSPTC